MKRFKGICVALCLLMLAGCGNKEPETTSSTVSGDGFDLPGLKPATTTEAATEATTEVTTEATTEEVSGGSEDIIYYASDKALFLSPRDIKDYLDGYWELVPNGQPIMDMDVVADTFYFNGETGTAVYNRGSDGEYIRFDFDAENLFEYIPGTNNLIKMTITEVSPEFSEYPDAIMGTSVYFQVVMANDGVADTLLLREIGNGDAQFCYDGLGYDRQAFDGFWVFMSLDEGEPKMDRVNNIYDQLVLKNSTFYAFLYKNMGDRVTLQRVLINPEVLNLYGEDVDVYSYTYPKCEYPLSTVSYYVEGMEDYANSGGYDPGLFRIVTDENGKITEMERLVYDIYGYYYQEGVSQATYTGEDGPDGDGPDVRDPEYYKATDDVYLGMWEMVGDPMTTLSVVMDSPQVGGYELLFDFYRLTYADCFANIREGDLVTNQGVISNDKNFGGILTPTDRGIKFIVTESEFDGIEAGTEYEFVRPY